MWNIPRKDGMMEDERTVSFHPLLYNTDLGVTVIMLQDAFPCEESPSLYGAVEFGKIPDY